MSDATSCKYSTIFGWARAIAGIHDLSVLAARTGVNEQRLRAIEAGSDKFVTPTEKANVERVLGAPMDALVQPFTIDGAYAHVRRV